MSLDIFLSTKQMMKLCLIITLFHSIQSLRLFKIDSATYVSNDTVPIVFQDDSCDRCVCQAYTNYTQSFVAVNCFESGNRCEIFLNTNGDYTLVSSLNFTLFINPTLANALNRTVTSSSSLRWSFEASTVAGFANGTNSTSPDGLYIPQSLAFDGNRSLYITDSYNNRIQRVFLASSNRTSVAGIGPGLSPLSIPRPMSIALDAALNMYFTDSQNHVLMLWAHGAASETIIAGTVGVSGNNASQFNYPSGLLRMADTGILYIADCANHRIMQYQANASFGTVVAGGNDNGTAYNQLYLPYALAYDALSDSLIIVNMYAHNVVRWVLGASSWTLIAGTTGASGNTPTTLSSPGGLALDPMGNVYVADTYNHRIQLFLVGQSQGITIAGMTGSPGTSATQLSYPYGVFLDAQLNLFIPDTLNNRVQLFSRLY